MRNPFLSASLLFLTAVPIFAQSQSQVEYSDADVHLDTSVAGQKGAEVLTVARPMAVDGDEAYNGTSIPITAGLSYNSNLVIKAAILLEANVSPRNLGINITTKSGKIAWLGGHLSMNQVTNISIPLSNATVKSDSPNQHPLDPTDKIVNISIYAHFSEATSSKFTVQSFSIVSGGS